MRVTDINSKEDMFLNLSTVFAIRKNSNTKGASVLLSNGVWIECAETFEEFRALVEDRDPTVAKLLFNNRDNS